MADDAEAPSQGNRARIMAAAAELVARGGVKALTTRAIAAAAGCQAPAIYRQFGDKQGLLDAIAEQALAHYAERTLQQAPMEDPLEELRSAWNEHIAFGLAHPAVYRLMSNGERPGHSSPAAQAGMTALRGRVHRVARAGRLRVSEERAVFLIHAAGTGTVTALLEMPSDRRDEGLSALAREAVMAAILTEAAPDKSWDTAQCAGALRTRIDDARVLTPGERMLMHEMLVRLSDVV